MPNVRRMTAVMILASAVFAAGLLTGNLRSQQQPDPLQGPANPSPLYVATFIDLMPTNLAAGTTAIKQYVIDTRKDAGNKSCQAIAQIAGRANHLVIMEVWQNEAAYHKHEETAHTKDYRAKMQPLIGAPFDEREHFLVE